MRHNSHSHNDASFLGEEDTGTVLGCRFCAGNMLKRWTGGALFVWMVLMLGCNAAAETMMVRLADNGKPNNPVILYRKELIELALQAAGFEPSVSFCQLPGGESSDRRLIHEVREGQLCDVLATSSGGETSQQLQLVPVPIYLGGGDLRVWLMSRTSLQHLEQPGGYENLQRVRLGSGTSWADTRVWELNGYSVERGDYLRLFEMLAAGRFDAYPRSVFEITAEFASLDPAVFALESRLMFRMNTGIFFYVSPRDRRLGKALTRGLHRLYCSGEFEQFMRRQRSTRDAFRTLLGSSRRLVELVTPEPPAQEARALREYVPSWLDAQVRERTCARP